jgi:hypothetical protein
LKPGAFRLWVKGCNRAPSTLWVNCIHRVHSPAITPADQNGLEPWKFLDIASDSNTHGLPNPEHVGVWRVRERERERESE